MVTNGKLNKQKLRKILTKCEKSVDLLMTPNYYSSQNWRELKKIKVYLQLYERLKTPISEKIISCWW